MRKKYTGMMISMKLEYGMKVFSFVPLDALIPTPGCITLLIGAVEKGSNFKPRNAPEVAASRRKLISCNRSLIHEYESYIAPVKKSDER